MSKSYLYVLNIYDRMELCGDLKIQIFFAKQHQYLDGGRFKGVSF